MTGQSLLDRCKQLEAAGWPVNDLVQVLRTLPSEDEYHPHNSARLIGRHFPGAIAAFQSILADHSLEPSVRHQAFVAVATLLHNQMEYSKLRLVLESNKSSFTPFLRWRLFATLPVFLTSRDDFSSALDQIEAMASKASSDPGILAHYSDLVATSVEKHPDLPRKDERLERGLALINRALQIEDYAKYYYIRGRLHLLLSSPVEAEQNALQAIDKEDMTRGDYAIRIQRYHQLLMLIDLSRTTIQLSKKFSDQLQQAISKQEEQARAKQLEFVGFFVAVMSFVMTGFGLAQRYPVVSAAQLLFATASCLVAAIAGFSLLSRTDKIRDRAVSIILACVLSAGLLAVSAFAIPYFFTDAMPTPD